MFQKFLQISGLSSKMLFLTSVQKQTSVSMWTTIGLLITIFMDGGFGIGTTRREESNTTVSAKVFGS